MMVTDLLKRGSVVDLVLIVGLGQKWDNALSMTLSPFTAFVIGGHDECRDALLSHGRVGDGEHDDDGAVPA